MKRKGTTDIDRVMRKHRADMLRWNREANRSGGARPERYAELGRVARDSGRDMDTELDTVL